MKHCTRCGEDLPLESFKGKNHKSCINCSGTPTSPAMSAKNFKWRVAIQTCVNNHKYVPIAGQCPICNPQAGLKKVILKKCAWCPKNVQGGQKKFCGKVCAYNATQYRKNCNECKHCEEPLPPENVKFCSLRCADDYQANKLRISKL